jgi:hypothetical protein
VGFNRGTVQGKTGAGAGSTVAGFEKGQKISFGSCVRGESKYIGPMLVRQVWRELLLFEDSMSV